MDSLLLPITQPCLVLMSIPLSEHSWPPSLVLQGESCLGDSSTWEGLFIPNPHLHSTPFTWYLDFSQEAGEKLL